jgi:hypothetical protein
VSGRAVGYDQSASSTNRRSQHGGITNGGDATQYTIVNPYPIHAGSNVSVLLCNPRVHIPVSTKLRYNSVCSGDGGGGGMPVLL